MSAQPNLSPSERSQRAKLASHVSWARTPDPSARTEPGRRTFLSRFEDEVDPNRELPESERIRRAEHARKAYFTRLAFASAKARRKAAEGAGDE